jgi:exonuclease III
MVLAKPKKARHCQVATINIHAGHGAASHNLQAVAKDGDEKQLDIIRVQGTKITNEKHATRAGNFDIIASETSTRNQGGVAFFVRWQAKDSMVHRGPKGL